MKKFFRYHRIALLLTLGVAMLYGLHHSVLWYQLRTQGMPYYPTLIGVDERYNNIPPSKAVYETGNVTGDTALAENAGTPGFLPPIPHLVMGYMARALGSLNAAFIASTIIFPALSFFLLYLLALEITGSRGVSHFFAMLSAIIPRYLAFFPLLTKYYQAWFITQLFNPQTRLFFNRFEDPLLTTPLFFLTLWLIARSLLKNEKYTPYFAGLALGALFYTYFYYPVYIAAALGIMALIFLIRKDYRALKKIVLIVEVTALVSLYHWIRLFEFSRYPTYRDIMLRVGPERGYAPFLYAPVVFTYVQHSLLALAAYLCFRKERFRLAAYFVGLLLPVYIVYNFQILTGFNPQPDHWIKPRQFVLTLTFIALGFFLINRYGKKLLRVEKWISAGIFLAVAGLILKGIITHNQTLRVSLFILAGAGTVAIAGYWYAVYVGVERRRYGRILVWCAIGLLFLKGLHTQYRYIGNNRTAATIPSAEEKSYQWLNAHTPSGSVVGTPSFVTNIFIKHLTHNKIFVPNGWSTVASMREILERFMMLNRALEVPPEKFGEYFATAKTYPPKDEDHEGISYIFHDYYRARAPGSIFSSKGQHAPQWNVEFHQRVVTRYRSLKPVTPDTLPYRLDYFYYGQRERELVKDPKLAIPGLVLVYEKEGVTIYQLR